ncbi:MAG: zinc ribbon domain-containing protein [Candidatus Sericytochromatia bacterium]|nr:zinc ribbon domain-containing protein [Candidatus Sericytochromatia bacterium]
MPRYDYKCKNCDSSFFITCGINESRENVICSNCQNNNVSRIFNSIILKNRKNEDQIEVKDLEENKSHDVQNVHEHDHCSPDLDYI